MIRASTVLSSALFGIGCITQVIATAQEPPAARLPAIDLAALDLRKTWFTPQLVRGEGALCNTLLADAKRYFATAQGWSGYMSEPFSEATGFRPVELPYPGGTATDPSLSPLSDLPFHYMLQAPNQAPLYLYFHRNPGCGGACESQQLVISEQRFQEDMRGRDSLDISGTRAAESWTLYKSEEGAWYAAAVAEDHLQVHALQPRQFRSPVCDVAVAPADLRESKDPGVRTAWQALDAFKAAGYQFLAGAGDCGSMRTNGRWRKYIADALELTLYRPWQLAHATTRLDGGNGYGNYPAMLPDLENWSLTGLTERATLERYTTQLGSSIDVLQRFYMQSFGWDERVAARIAYEALTSALSRGMGFSADYEPFTSPAERQLRVAIFQRQPLEQLRSIDADPVAMAAVLDIAIEYPAVLRYLLERGADPNRANAFGKTPLMYAVQSDAKAAVQLLLQSGADPNAATVYPNDNCYYTLETSGMTALHYAVRYASAAVVELLLNQGALTFNRAEGRNEGYPLDWLRRYTMAGAAEPNSNITPAEARELATLLRVPADTERAAFARERVLRAEADYAAGKLEPAYRDLQAALNAQPSNQRARDDLILVALKSSRIGVALQAAEQLIASDASPQLKARAWFNTSLACQRGQQFFMYDGTYYCRQGVLEPMLKSWMLQPTTARKNAIAALFETDAIRSCVVSSGGVGVKYHLSVYEPAEGRSGSRRATRIYAYHDSKQRIDPTAISWRSTEPDPQNDGRYKQGSSRPTLAQRYDFGAFAITVLESPWQAQSPVSIGTSKCEDVDMR